MFNAQIQVAVGISALLLGRPALISAGAGVRRRIGEVANPRCNAGDERGRGLDCRRLRVAVYLGDGGAQDAFLGDLATLRLDEVGWREIEPVGGAWRVGDRDDDGARVFGDLNGTGSAANFL